MEPTGSGSSSSRCSTVTFEDVNILRKVHGGVGDAKDVGKRNIGFDNLASVMKQIGKQFVDDEILVKTSYGVPVPGRRRSKRKDPRVKKQIRLNKEHYGRRAKLDKRRRQEYEDALLNGIPPATFRSFSYRSYTRGSSSSSSVSPSFITLAADRYLERCRRELSKPPFDEKAHDFPPEVIQQEFWSEDITAASLGLAAFNSKFSDQPPYFLEEVYGTQIRVHVGITWMHGNFRASQKDGSPSKLFFVELYRCSIVTFCCTLDGRPQKRGCSFCPRHFVHPKEGGFLHGIHLNMDEDQNARLAKSLAFRL